MVCRPQALDVHLDYGAKGILLALAHEFDMPAMTSRMRHMLLQPMRDSFINDFVEAASKKHKPCSSEYSKVRQVQRMNSTYKLLLCPT